MHLMIEHNIDCRSLMYSSGNWRSLTSFLCNYYGYLLCIYPYYNSL